MSNLTEKALLASYRVAFRVTKAGMPCTIAEKLILPVVNQWILRVVRSLLLLCAHNLMEN